MSLAVTLQGKTYPVVLPRRYAETRELVQLAYVSAFRGAGAVLAMCVPALAVKAEMRGCRGDIAEFGMIAWEDLHARGIEDGDMVKQAQPIIDALVAKAFPSAEEVKEAEVFSGQPGAGPTTTP